MKAKNEIKMILLFAAVLLLSIQDCASALSRVRPVDYYQQGMNAFNAGDYTSAINSFNTALSRNPNDTSAYLSRGVAYQRLGNTAAALSDFSNVVARDPANKTALLARADIYIQSGNTGAAISDFSKVISVDPGNTTALLARANIFIKVGNNNAALGDFNNVIARDPGNKAALLARADIYTKSGNTAAAINDLSSVLSKEPGNAAALLARAETYKRLGNNADAIKDYAKLITVNPKDSGAYYNIGEMYFKTGNLADAKTYLQRAKELGDKSPNLDTCLQNAIDGLQARDDNLLARAVNEAEQARAAGLNKMNDAAQQYALAQRNNQSAKAQAENTVKALQSKKDYLVNVMLKQYQQRYQPTIDNYNATKATKDDLIKKRDAAQAVVDAGKRITDALSEKNAAEAARVSAKSAYETVKNQTPPPQTITTRVRRGFGYRTYTDANPAYQAYQTTCAQKLSAYQSAEAAYNQKVQNYNQVMTSTAAVLTGTQNEIQKKVEQAKKDVTQLTTYVGNYNNSLKGMEQPGSSYMNALGMMKQIEATIGQTDKDIMTEKGKLTAADAKLAQAQSVFDTARSDAEKADKKVMELRGMQVFNDIGRAMGQAIGGDQVKISYDEKQQKYIGTITGKNNVEVGKINATVDRMGAYTLNVTTGQGLTAAQVSGAYDAKGNYRAMVNMCSANQTLSGLPYQGNVNNPAVSFKQAVVEKMKPVLRGAAAKRVEATSILDKAISDRVKVSTSQGNLPAGVQFTDKAPSQIAPPAIDKK